MVIVATHLQQLSAAPNFEYVGMGRRALNGQSLKVRVRKVPGASQLDSAGQAILKLLHKAAGTAEANRRRALETAQKLSSQLEATKDRIAELEAKLQFYRENRRVAQ